RRLDRQLTRQSASWDSAWARQAVTAVEWAAGCTKLWWGLAAVMIATGGRSGIKAAAAGLLSMLTAELVSNAVGKQISERRRPPEQLVPHDVEDRPDTSSFPSGHTAAALGFTAAVASSSPGWGAAAAVPTAIVAVERVHSGAHYPSDVVGGAAIGLASAWLIHRATRPLLRGLLR
ncbi:phosphatase PAP2 family protein, partial [Streptomyces sp. NPDC019443]|uniref:phosphatase PAP2 family protein n=1 Tax=Streptomyces sp. NPDC019443 TaxID=3365061 RepID=UPI0037B996EF